MLLGVCPLNTSAKSDSVDQQPPKQASRFGSILRLVSLFIIGPPVFLFIAYIPLLCKSRQGFRGWYWRLVKRSCSLLLWFLNIRTSISDDNIESLAKDTNSIIACNHRSLLDGFVLMDTIPDEKWFTFASKKELFDSPLLRTGFVAADLVKIDRASGRSAMQELTRAVVDMPSRRSAVMFVEGTRSTGSSLGNFKAGVVVSARKSGRKIRPIVIRHSDRLMPKGKRIPRAGTVEVCVLPAFDCDLNATVEEDLARLRSKMKDVFDGS